MSNPAVSDKQVAFIERLATERRTALGIEDVADWITDNGVRSLDRASASTLIERLLAMKVAKDMPDGYQGPESDRVIANRFAQPCSLCSGEVEATQGHAALVASKWLTFHREGSCGETPATTGLDLAALDQFLTSTGHKDNRTCFFAHPAHGTGAVEDVTRQRVKLLLAGSGWRTIYDVNVYAGQGQPGFGTRFGSQRPGGTYVGKATELVEAILADPAGALAAYGHLTNTCAICRRPLEDEQSVARGIGPICAEKVGL